MGNDKDSNLPKKIEKPRIKFAPLENGIPQDNELRDYLETKEETGNVFTPITSKIYRFSEKSEEWPRTLLLMPPITLSEGTVKRTIPPLGLAYIAGYCEKEGVPVELLDCVVEGRETEQCIGNKTWMYGLTDDQIRARIEKFKPNIVGISILYSSDFHSMIRLAKLIKEINKETIVVVGGIHPTIYPRETLTESFSEKEGAAIDYVIRGEGEIRFVDFVKGVKDGFIDLGSDGLCGWHNGEMFINPQREVIKDIDSIPFPAYHKLPIEEYFSFNVPFSPFPRGNRVLQLYTSRGCPVGCTFCSSTNFNKGYRMRSPDNVIEEIMYFKEKYNIDEIQFADDNLTFNRKRSLEFFEKLKGCGLQWCTPNGTLVNSLTEELLDKMIDSGLYQVTLSLDSGSAKVLKEHHRKPVNLERVPDLAAFLLKRGVLIHATLVVGMPGETLDDIDEGFRYVENLPLDSIAVFIAQALPGSELFETAIVSGAIDRKKARTIIDTTKNNIALSDIPKHVLEKKVEDFLYSYNKTIRARNPEKWELKYSRHKDRLARICIGHAAPNTDGVINAAEPTPHETLPANG